MSSKRDGRTIYSTPEEAQVDALVQVQDVPAEHNVFEVKFGEFAEGVGGGFYLVIRVNYEITNTVVPPAPAPADLRKKRIKLVTDAYAHFLAKRAAEAVTA